MSEKVQYDIKGLTEDELIESLEKPIMVFVGAGLSIPAPTCAPSWWTLTQDLLKSYFAKVTQIEEIKQLGDLSFKVERQPEEVFENFAAILGDKFYEVFGVLQEGSSNAAHIALARLMKNNLVHAIITTNFDLYIEEALKNEGVDYRLVVTNREFHEYKESGYPGPALLKIHGTVERPETIVSVSSQYKTSKGFSVPKAEVFRYLMSKYECVFLGYSGWDYTHDNYRKFWEKASSNIRGIIWNVRPGETEGPPLRNIIPIDSFRFTEGELPLAIINTLNKKGVDTTNLPLLEKEDSNREFNESSDRRKTWLDKWVEQIPKPFILGLTLTDIQNYSKEWQEYLGDGWEAQKKQTDMQMDFNQQIMDLMAKMQSGELDMPAYNEQVAKLMAQKQETYDTLVPEEKKIKGTFDIRPVLELFFKSVLESEEQHFPSGIDALALTLLYLSEKEILDIASKLIPEEDFNEIKSSVEDPSNMEKIDKIIRHQFEGILERCHALKCDKKVFAKLELGMASLWMSEMKRIFPVENKAFTPQEADYLTFKFPPYIFQKIRKIFDSIIEELDNFNSTYRQLIYSNLAQLAEAGDDLELAEFAVKSSLKDTEGKVTEATQSPIPEVLGGFYDRRQNWNEALRWYDLALDGLLYVNIRIMADKITYRAMVCNEQLGKKKRALEIGFRYLSEYADIEMVFAPIHKKHARDMIARLVNELGYSSIEKAYEELIS